MGRRVSLFPTRRPHEQHRASICQRPDFSRAGSRRACLVWRSGHRRHFLTQLGMLTTFSDQVRFARKRFGTYEVIDA